MPLAPPIAVPAAVDAPAKGAGTESPNGLTSEEARRLSNQFGPNSMPDTSAHPARMAIEKLWAPIPWMLEAAIVLELMLGKYIEAGIISVLLLFNAALGFFQEGRARETLAALKNRLALTAAPVGVGTTASAAVPSAGVREAPWRAGADFAFPMLVTRRRVSSCR